MAEKWIQKAIKRPGALRSSLGVKAGQKIPAKKLATAAKAPGKMGQRARLAQTLKGMKKYAYGGEVTDMEDLEEVKIISPRRPMPYDQKYNFPPRGMSGMGTGAGRGPAPPPPPPPTPEPEYFEDQYYPEPTPIPPTPEPIPGYEKSGPYAKGGSVRSSASRRGDGIAQRGKTKGRFV